MKNKYLVSVIMPVYNEDKYLSYAIESVLSQSYINFEFIIVDDLSTDSSFQICKKYQEKDKRIILLKNKVHLGIGATLNHAINKTKGEYMARMDADDIMSKYRLEKQIQYLKSHKDFVCVGSWMKEINDNNNIIGKRTPPLDHHKIYESMFYTMGIQNPTLMINKKFVPKDFDWCKTDGILDDLDLLFKLVNFGKFANLKEYLMQYRIHENNLSLKDIKKTFFEALSIRRRAVQNNNYIPTIKAKLISLLQILTVIMIPERFLYGVYKLFSRLNHNYHE